VCRRRAKQPYSSLLTFQTLRAQGLWHALTLPNLALTKHTEEKGMSSERQGRSLQASLGQIQCSGVEPRTG